MTSKIRTSPYRLILWSHWIGMVVPMLIVVLTFISIRLFHEKSSSAFWPVTIGSTIIIGAFYLRKYITIAKIDISLTDYGINLKWVKQFPFHKRPNMEIAYSDITKFDVEFVSVPATSYINLKLFSKSKDPIEICHNTDIRKRNDFLEFIDDFISKMDDLKISGKVGGFPGFQDKSFPSEHGR